MQAEMVATEIPASALNKPAKKIFKMLDVYIEAMQMNQGRYPTAAYINKTQAQTLQSALNALADKSGQKVEPMKVANLTYRGLPFVIA